jgi:hypothetical protein
MTRGLLVSILLPLACFPQTTPTDLRVLVRDAMRFVDPEHNRSGDYGFTYRVDRKEFHSDGKLKSREWFVGRKEFEQGHPVWRLSEKNGKPLTSEDLEQQEKGIREYLAARTSEAAEQQTKRRQQADGEDAWLKEVPEALNFQLVGREQVNARTAGVLTCEPRPGYSAKARRARVFEKMRGRMWIDEQDRELAKAEAETFDRVNVGFGILGRIEKGTRIELLRRRVDSGAWLLESQLIKFGARILLFKWHAQEVHTILSDWKRK